MKKLLICILAILLIGCVSAMEKTPKVSELEKLAEGAAGKWSDYSDMSAGQIADADTFLVRDVDDDTLAATGTQKEYPWSVLKSDFGSMETDIITSLPHTVTAAQVKGHWLVVTAAGDVDLPGTPAVGDIICVEEGDASELVEVAVGNSSHNILYNGQLLGTNHEINSPNDANAAGAYICMHYTETNLWRVRGSQGTWVDGGTVD